MIVNCSILCAADYAEESLRHAENFLILENIQVTFLGLNSNAFSGTTGESLSPTSLLSIFDGEETTLRLPGSLLIAGGAACGRRLLADPRVHRLIEAVILAKKPVGFLHPVSYSLVNLLNQNLRNQPLLLQESKALTNFLHQFVLQLRESAKETGSKTTTPSK